MPELQAHGLEVATPSGWEGRIFRRAAHGETMAEVAGMAAPAGEETFPVVHVATVALPMDIADYGSDVVEDLGRDDALVVLKEFSPEDVGQPLFEKHGVPRALRTGDFDRGALQRSLPDQAGYQSFCNEGGRTFCLYVVLGDYARRAVVVPRVNAVLAGIVIDPLIEDEDPEEGDVSTPTSTTLAPEPPTTLPEEAPTVDSTTTSLPPPEQGPPGTTEP